MVLLSCSVRGCERPFERFFSHGSCSNTDVEILLKGKQEKGNLTMTKNIWPPVTKLELASTCMSFTLKGLCAKLGTATKQGQ